MPVPRTHLEPSLKDLYDYLDSVGTTVSKTVLSGSPVSLSTTVPSNVTSITLTPGTWELSGVVGYLPAGTTSITVRSGGTSTTSATLGAVGSKFVMATPAVVPGAVGQEQLIPTTILTVVANTVVYLVASATFTVSTLGAYGSITAKLLNK